MTIQYATTYSTIDNKTESISDDAFIARLKKSLTTYEDTGDRNNVTKLYIDVDIKTEELQSQTINGIKSQLKSIIKSFLSGITNINPRLCFASSHGVTADGQKKISFRIYIPNIKMKKDKMKAFFEKTNLIIFSQESHELWEYIDRTNELFDSSVYSHHRKMRCIGTSKPNEKRPLICDDDCILEDTVITGFFDKDVEFVDFEMKEKNSNTTQKSNTPTTTKETVMQLLLEKQIFRSIAFGGREKWIKLGMALKNEFGENGRQYFHQISKLDIQRYDSIEIDTQFDSFKIGGDRKITWNTIMAFVKDESEEIWNESIEMLKEKTHIAHCDKDAAEIIIQKLGDSIVTYKGRIFLKKDNKWLSDMSIIDTELINIIMYSNIYSEIEEKKNKFKPYAQNISKAKNIRETIYELIKGNYEKNNFYDLLHTTTKGKLCFENGVLDLLTKEFKYWEDCQDIYTTIIIPRNYTPSDEQTRKTIITNIFEPLFGDRLETALHFYSRAIAGMCGDKNYSTYLGNRDCGKGVLFELFQRTFCDYVKTFELTNMMYNRRTEGLESLDCSKKLYWLLDYEFVRLAISQEVPESNSSMKINSKLLKKIAGGDDTMVARRNYDRVDTHFKIETTWAIMGNNSLKYDNNDCLEHCVEFQSVCQFKTQSEIDSVEDEDQKKRYRVKDYTIKQKCSSNEWCNACIDILLHSYKDYPVDIKIENQDDDELPIILELKKYFDFSDTEAMMLPVDVFSKISNPDKKKVEYELKNMNVFKKKSSKTLYRNKQVFVGIKEKIITEDEVVN